MDLDNLLASKHTNVRVSSGDSYFLKKYGLDREV